MSKRPPFLQSLGLDKTRTRTGTVFLVGAGPGDPELLTLRAARLLGSADAVVYDNLVGKGILDMARPDAERIYVGKQKDNHTLPQHEINALLVRLAQQGKQVVRLKGGDPFIFGRGGEELETLAEANIRYEVVPGITAASGVSCYTGIPLTHRDYAQSCLFTTGHLKDGSLNLDWEILAHPRQTVVIYMGLGALPEISEKLVEHGRAASTPVAVVEQGTTRRQRVATGTLATIAERVAAQKFKSPCLIIVGEVTQLHDKLQWFAGSMPQLATAVA
ncbi:MAG: uroporphyrinogen-III C-methyltransferase [Bacillota bacterium]